MFGVNKMSGSELSLQQERPAAYRYGLAMLACAVALGIKLLLLRFGVSYPLSSSFLAAIAVAFWFGGTGPGLLAVVLSSLAFGVIVAPRQIELLEGVSKTPSLVSILPYLVYFWLVALLMSWFSSSRRKAEQLLSQSRSDLEIKVEERTADLREANQNLRDEITERRHAEEALYQAQADLAHVSRVTTMGELVALIAHEVNQPLGAIVTNGSACVRLLSREPPELDKSRAIVERIIDDGMRASEVIKRIRGLLHKAPSQKAPLDINETVLEVVELVRSDVRRGGVAFLTDLAGDLPPVLGDRVQLQQVILNLILNAKDAMKGTQTGPRELRVTSSTNGAVEVVVAVRDTGRGLDPQDAERVFDPFFTTKAEGTGLGLSISRRIIEDHGGLMWAAANRDQGTTVQFSLPLVIGRES